MHLTASRLARCLLSVCLLSRWALALAAEPEDLQVVAPDSVKSLLINAAAPTVSTARIDDEGDLAQLLRRLRPVWRSALGAQGYFSPTFTRLPLTQKDELRLSVKVVPGPLAKVSKVNIEIRGALADDSPGNEQRRAALKEEWALKEGAPFSQSDWSKSKQGLVGALVQKDYAAARLVDSVARVDTQNNAVELDVIVDSGPRYVFGAMQVQGLSRYKGDLVARFNTIKPGDAYDQDRLLALQSDLQNTAYFSSVDVDANPLEPEALDGALSLPVKVNVTEAQSKRVGLGAGISSNTGLRTELSYRDQNFLKEAYALSSGVRLEQKRQTVYADVFLPPKGRGLTDSLGASFDRLDAQGLVTRRTALGAQRRDVRGNISVTYGLTLQHEAKEQNALPVSSIFALVGSASWTRRQVNDLYFPTQGHIFNAQIATAAKALGSETDFVRLYGRYQRYWAFGTRNNLMLRAELGSVVTPNRLGVPQEFLFRTGGTGTVRGLDFLGLGLRENDAIVGGRRMALGSLEYTRWLTEKWGAATFVDTGSVTDNWRNLDFRTALGMGARYKTPAGPLAVDVAKAESEKSPRLHFSLGVAF